MEKIKLQIKEEQEAGAGERLGGPHSTHSRSRACTHVKASDRSSRLATPPHSVCLFRKHHQTMQQCPLFICPLYDRSSWTDVVHTRTQHHLQAKKSSASPTSNHDTTGSFSLHPHGRIFHRLGFGLLARCCLPS